ARAPIGRYRLRAAVRVADRAFPAGDDEARMENGGRRRRCRLSGSRARPGRRSLDRAQSRREHSLRRTGRVARGSARGRGGVLRMDGLGLVLRRRGIAAPEGSGVKRWKRDLGIVRELGPDEPRFDAAVARVWADLEAREREIEQLRQTCGISFSDKDTGIKTLIARAEAAEAELQRVKAERDE